MHVCKSCSKQPSQLCICVYSLLPIMDDLSVSSDLPKNQRELFIELRGKKMEATKNSPSSRVMHI